MPSSPCKKEKSPCEKVSRGSQVLLRGISLVFPIEIRENWDLGQHAASKTKHECLQVWSGPQTCLLWESYNQMAGDHMMKLYLMSPCWQNAHEPEDFRQIRRISVSLIMRSVGRHWTLWYICNTFGLAQWTVMDWSLKWHEVYLSSVVFLPVPLFSFWLPLLCVLSWSDYKSRSLDKSWWGD